MAATMLAEMVLLAVVFSLIMIDLKALSLPGWI
jgi:hypothetical protein